MSSIESGAFGRIIDSSTEGGQNTEGITKDPLVRITKSRHFLSVRLIPRIVFGLPNDLLRWVGFK